MQSGESDVPDFYTGSPVDPEDLWFRDSFIEEMWEVLSRQHGIISAPRRTGKTSVMDHLVEYPKSGFHPVKIFVQDLDHPAEFILTLLDAFHDLHPDLFKAAFQTGFQIVEGVLSRIGEIGVGGFKVALREQDPDWERNWKKHGDNFFERVRNVGEPVLFIVDEFPDMILNMDREHPDLVQPFLAWFRGHRLTPRPKKDAVRWLLGGSVNLSSTLDSMGCLDMINDFHEETLPVLSFEEVTEFVGRMLAGRGVLFEEGFPQAIAARVGSPVPLFLQMLTQDCYRIWKRKKDVLTESDFEKAFNDLVISSAARDKLQHYYSRISEYYREPKRTAAYELLGRLSVSAEGLGRDTLYREFERVLHDAGDAPLPHERKQLFNQLLRDLENDFYVSEVDVEDSRYDFSSGLLKAWWRKYYA